MWENYDLTVFLTHVNGLFSSQRARYPLGIYEYLLVICFFQETFINVIYLKKLCQILLELSFKVERKKQGRRWMTQTQLHEFVSLGEQVTEGRTGLWLVWSIEVVPRLLLVLSLILFEANPFLKVVRCWSEICPSTGRWFLNSKGSVFSTLLALASIHRIIE